MARPWSPMARSLLLLSTIIRAEIKLLRFIAMVLLWFAVLRVGRSRPRWVVFAPPGRKVISGTIRETSPQSLLPVLA